MKRKNITLSRNLRKNQTDAEKKLWFLLRDRGFNGIKFRRQFSIGNYILDFYSSYYKLAIEADGGQHYTQEGIEKDEIRSRELQKMGIRILRLSDSDIFKNTDEVCELIEQTIEQIKETPSPFRPRRIRLWRKSCH